MKTLVEHVAKALVDDPEQVSVTEREVEGEGDNSVLELRLAPGDVGRVLGRQGRTARSLRTILTAAGNKAKKRYTLEIIE